MRRGDLVGQILDDRYRVIEPVGEGAMGSVYRGERLKLGRMVAIKVLNEAIPNDASRRRFEREAMAMAKLEHPNCGSVLDVGVHDGRPYVVMEFVSGQNLKDVLKAGALPVARAVEITRQVLSGLSHAHELGLIHRDIKPANIVLSQKSGVGDHVKILDFGLARSTQDTSNLTGGLVLGTPNYMAPEQIRGGQIDHRIDLYACGVMLFELLTGAKPFHADDPMAVCMQHLNNPPPTLAEKGGKSFGALEAIVARALAKDREQRFASAEEFAKALVDAAKNVDAKAPASKQPKPAAKPPAAKQPTTPTKPLKPAAKTLEIEEPKAPAAATVPFDAAPILAQSGAITAGAQPARATTNRRTLAIVGASVLAIAIVVGVVVATKSDPTPAEAKPAATSEDRHAVAKPTPAPDDGEPAKPTAAPAPSEPTSEGADPVADLIARALEMNASGRRGPALDMLLDAKKSYPKDARLPYHASKLYLEKMWWEDGLKQARAAIALDPAYRTDGELIKLVLKGFNTTKSYDWTLAKFLREDVGEAAKPYMEDTARAHPNPIVRKRAAAELKKYD